MQRLIQSKKLLYFIALVAAITLFYLPMLNVKFTTHIKHEFNNHVTFAIWMLEEPERLPLFVVAHPLYPFLVAAVIKLAGLAPKAAGAVVSLAAYLGLGGIIYAAAYQRFAPPSTRTDPQKPLLDRVTVFQRLVSPGSLALLLTLALMLLSQIPVLFFHDRLLYFGYIGINVYLNSTSNLMKPFAVLGFLLALRAFGSQRRGWGEIALNALVTVLSTLNKPNFIICFLPALAGMVLLKLVEAVREDRPGNLRTGQGWLATWRTFSRRLDWRLIVFGIVLPAGLTLVWQYSVTYLEGESTIEFSPFQLMSYYSDNLLPKFLGSILFPFSLAVAYFKDLRKNESMRLAWLIFLFGAFYTYFMTTNAGGRYKDGNFYWSGEIALFVLFVASALYWVEKIRAAGRLARRDLVLLVIFGLHLISGFFYYAFSILVDDYDRLGSWRNLLEGW